MISGLKTALRWFTCSLVASSAIVVSSRAIGQTVLPSNTSLSAPDLPNHTSSESITPNEAATPDAASVAAPDSASLAAPAPLRKKFSLSNWVGISYAIFFGGPGLSGNGDTSPNHIGRPNDDGLFTSNTISFRFKVWERWALDFQTRTRFVFNDSRPANRRQDEFSAFRWESPSIGVSGELLKGADWVMKGAINTDFPYFVGDPFSGFTSRLRTTIATPGLFASLRWAPKGTRWSLFSVVNPRWFIYEERFAVEPQFARAGRIPQNKREFDLSFRPSANYLLTEKIEVSVGTSVSYNKQVGSSWNPFQASLVQNGEGTEWRLDPMPIQLGSTYNFSKELRIFAFLQGFPIAAQRFDARPDVRSTVGFEDTISLGVDVMGTVF